MLIRGVKVLEMRAAREMELHQKGLQYMQHPEQEPGIELGIFLYC